MKDVNKIITRQQVINAYRHAIAHQVDKAIAARKGSYARQGHQALLRKLDTALHAIERGEKPKQKAISQLFGAGYRFEEEIPPDPAKSRSDAWKAFWTITDVDGEE
jgi:hypothetical protein